MNSRDWRSRFGRALAVVAVLLALPFVASFAVPERSASAVAGRQGGLLESARVVSSGGYSEALERIEAAAVAGRSEAPAYFEEEAYLHPAARDLRANEEGTVIGYMVDADSEDVFAQIRDAMCERGWTEVPLGGVRGSTFLKTGGECTWALVTCTQVDGTASVVFRCVVA